MKKIIKKGLMALTLTLGMALAAPQQANAGNVTVAPNNSQITLSGPQAGQKVVHSDDNVTIIVIDVKVGDRTFTTVVLIDNRGQATTLHFGSE